MVNTKLFETIQYPLTILILLLLDLNIHHIQTKQLKTHTKVHKVKTKDSPNGANVTRINDRRPGAGRSLN